jgi:hypothetical protein
MNKQDLRKKKNENKKEKKKEKENRRENKKRKKCSRLAASCIKNDAIAMASKKPSIRYRLCQ